MKILLISDSDKRSKMAFITPFTFIHFLNGILFYIASVQLLRYDFHRSLIVWSILHLVYEIKDFTYSYLINENSDTYNNNNSYINSVGDQIFAMLGFICGIYIPQLDWITFIIFSVFVILLARIFYYNQLG